MGNVIIILVAALEIIHYAILFSKQLTYVVTNTRLDKLVTWIIGPRSSYEHSSPHRDLRTQNRNPYTFYYLA